MNGRGRQLLILLAGIGAVVAATVLGRQDVMGPILEPPPIGRLLFGAAAALVGAVLVMRAIARFGDSAGDPRALIRAVRLAFLADRGVRGCRGLAPGIGTAHRGRAGHRGRGCHRDDRAHAGRSRPPWGCGPEHDASVQRPDGRRRSDRSRGTLTDRSAAEVGLVHRHRRPGRHLSRPGRHLSRLRHLSRSEASPQSAWASPQSVWASPQSVWASPQSVFVPPMHGRDARQRLGVAPRWLLPGGAQEPDIQLSCA